MCKINTDPKNGKIPITNDIMFGVVMQDKRAAKGVVELILGRKIHNISYPEGQKTLKDMITDRGVRLDVYFEDDVNTKYNIEMQTYSRDNIPKRTRYYHSKIDRNILKVGEVYEKLPNVYVIFICTFDPFESDLPLYTFEMMCREKPGLRLKDGQYSYYLNLSCDNLNNLDSELASMVKYMQGNAPKGDFENYLSKLENSIIEQDRRDGGVLMTLAEEMKIERESLIRQGVLLKLCELVNKKLLPVDVAAKEAGMSVEEFKELLEKH